MSHLHMPLERILTILMITCTEESETIPASHMSSHVYPYSEKERAITTPEHQSIPSESYQITFQQSM